MPDHVQDIAHYVGKSVRTLQRWERELGFPVRRAKAREKGTVLAIPREINSWVKSQQFPDGGGSDRATLLRSTLLRSLEALRTENRELRRQLASRAAGISNDG